MEVELSASIFLGAKHYANLVIWFPALRYIFSFLRKKKKDATTIGTKKKQFDFLVSK